MDLALNNLQRLICHKTKQTKPSKKENSEFKSVKLHLKTDLVSHHACGLGEYIQGWAEKFIGWSKHCNSIGWWVWTTLKNKLHLVTFYESILVSLGTFQTTLIHSSELQNWSLTITCLVSYSLITDLLYIFFFSRIFVLGLNKLRLKIKKRIIQFQFHTSHMEKKI